MKKLVSTFACFLTAIVSLISGWETGHYALVMHKMSKKFKFEED